MYKITDKASWERVVLPEQGSFLQSWAWNQTVNAGRCYFFADAQSGVAVVERTVPGGFRYWDMERAKPTVELMEQLAVEAKKEGAVFLRLTPELFWGDKFGSEFKDLGFVSPRLLRRSHSPSATLLVDLTKNEQQLLAEMHAKTRYNIRVAERYELTMVEGGAADFTVFMKLLDETAKRDGITLLPRRHYEHLLKLNENPRTILLFARIREQFLSAMILVIQGQTATYLHGGSSTKNRQMMASTFLQWEAMKLAKRLGCTIYDFWGIQMDEVPGAQPQESAWAGITRFKKGFGGNAVRYLGTKDLPLRPFLYKMLSVAANMRL